MTECKASFQSVATYACDVCGEPLDPIQAHMKPSLHCSQNVCRSFECKNILEHCATLQPRVAKLYIEMQRKLLAERKQAQREEEQRIEALEQAHCVENQQIFEKTFTELQGADTTKIQIVEIPTGLKRTSPLDSQRIKNYRQHLTKLAKSASQFAHSQDVPDDELHKTLEKRVAVENQLEKHPQIRENIEALCTLCKGGCCSSGKDTAYLSVLTLRRYMDAHPTMSVHGVIDSYMSRLSSSPVADSCINQTEYGCGLPRHMRSDICNGYFCDPIVEYQKKQESSTEELSIFAIRRANTNWNRLALDSHKHVVESKLLAPNK